MTEPGAKFDDGKSSWHLMPWDAVQGVVDVLDYGANKYCANGWQSVPDARNRYFSAAMRHVLARILGEHKDPESGLPHLAHAATNLLFLAWFDLHPCHQSGPQR